MPVTCCLDTIFGYVQWKINSKYKDIQTYTHTQIWYTYIYVCIYCLKYYIYLHSIIVYIYIYVCIYSLIYLFILFINHLCPCLPSTYTPPNSYIYIKCIQNPVGQVVKVLRQTEVTWGTCPVAAQINIWQTPETYSFRRWAATMNPRFMASKEFYNVWNIGGLSLSSTELIRITWGDGTCIKSRVDYVVCV